jgi:hypothetical protein
MKISNDIPDNYIIIKYGYTCDFSERTLDHIKTYGNIKGANLELMNYVYIDPKYLSKAETDIKAFFSDIENQIKYEKFKELIAINPKHEKQIVRQFKILGNEYSGCVKELSDKLEKAIIKHAEEILKERHKNELVVERYEKDVMKEKHKNDLLIKENQLLNKEIQLLSKDLEIEKLKNDMIQKNQNKSK